jgi:biotin transport system substrate-specific component
MHILFAISILCFLVLVWAAIAIARHIQADSSDKATSPKRN